MRLTIKTFGKHWDIYGENGRKVGKIKAIGKKELDILDTEGVQQFAVKKNDDQLIVLAKETEILSCSLLRETDAEGRPVQKTLLRPPMAQKLQFCTKRGPLTITQTPNRIFFFSLGEKSLGNITHMTRGKKEMELYSSQISPCQCMILMALSLFMFHDDDVVIV